MQLQDVINEIQNLGLNIEDQGHPADYVGVNIKKLKHCSFEFTQSVLLDSIIDDVRLKDAKVKPVPVKVSLWLHMIKKEPPFDLDFSHRSAVGKLNYLAQTTRPDIMYVTHQIAKYSSDPRQPHGKAILYFLSRGLIISGCYDYYSILPTKTKYIIIHLSNNKLLWYTLYCY